MEIMPDHMHLFVKSLPKEGQEVWLCTDDKKNYKNAKGKTKNNKFVKIL